MCLILIINWFSKLINLVGKMRWQCFQVLRLWGKIKISKTSLSLRCVPFPKAECSAQNYRA